MNPPKYSNLPLKFWSKVEVNPDTGCWEWTGAVRGKHNYGSYSHEGKTRTTHRLVAAEYYRGIPDGSLVLHHCDNTICLRFNHLYFGTHADNMRDMVERGRGNHTPHMGEENGNAKLTDQAVRDIRVLFSRDGVTRQSLSKTYGVSHSVVARVITGKAWSHVR